MAGPSRLEVQTATAKLKKYKWPGSDEILAELIQAGVETLLSVIHKLNSICNNEELPDQWKESINAPIHKKKGDKTGCNNYHGISLLSTSYKMLSNILLSSLSPYVDEITGIISVGFDVTNQLLIRFSAFTRYWIKNGSTMRQYINYS
jgi:hypothetical protein